MAPRMTPSLPTKAPRRAAAYALALFAVVAGLGACGSSDEPPFQTAGKNTPNIVLIESDDQARVTFKRSVMPRTFRLLVDHGTTFTDSVAAPPRCCPSRAGMITGQYPHNHGIVWDDADNLRNPETTLPVWLQDAGYRTAMIGKYLNGWDRPDPAPGWDRWLALAPEPSYYHARVSVDGDWRHLDQDQYVTDWLTRKADKFIGESASGSDPFFLWLTQYAPHARSGPVPACKGYAPVPAPGDLKRFRHAPLPHPSSFDEADVSDKPPSIRSLPRMDRDERALARRNYRCGLAALQDVDRGVASVMRTLRRSGAMGNTLVIFTSDNGVFYGEHRLAHGKVEPYEPAARVPLVMRAGPDVLKRPQTARAPAPVAQIDVAPTLLDLTGLQPCNGGDQCRVPDGRSLRGDLEGDPGPAKRGVLLELHQPGDCGFSAIRTARRTYVERGLPAGDDPCGRTFRELYDRRADPGELENVAKREPAIAGDLAERLAKLRECSGSAEGPDTPGDAPPCE
jgi:N-acetylglucosamine-6-sulfatase